MIQIAQAAEEAAEAAATQLASARKELGMETAVLRQRLAHWEARVAAAAAKCAVLRVHRVFTHLS